MVKFRIYLGKKTGLLCVSGKPKLAFLYSLRYIIKIRQYALHTECFTAALAVQYR